jgi:hypothetical protein
VPDQGEDDQAGAEGEQIKHHFAAQRVVNIRDGLLHGRDAEEMKVQGGANEETGEQQAE